MNKRIGLSLVMALGLVSVAHAEMENMNAMMNAEQPAPSAEAVSANAQAPVVVGNKICPVSHEEVGKGGMKPYQVTHNGKVYNLCCSMCEKDFNKDPEKYTKIMDEEVANAKGM